MVVFLVTWAGSLWISPAGPVFIGIYWLPILLISSIVAVLLACSLPPERPQAKVETISEVKREEAATRAFDSFFWLLLILLGAIVLLGYRVRPA
jgi:hypothetical protein